MASRMSMQSAQVSTTTLLNTLHTTYTSGRPYSLDASTSLVVNTWLSASEANHGEPVVDVELAQRAWEHARRRAEDGCIILGSLHASSPSLLTPVLSSLPLHIPSVLYTAVSVIRAFTCHVTPTNASQARHSALGVTLTLTLAGELKNASVALSTSGVDTDSALLNLPEQNGYRAFDVFYYLLTSASTPAEREFLGLRDPSTYSLLKKSETYDPPSYLPAADDAASADDFRNSLKTIGIKGSAQRNLLSVLAGLLKLGDSLGLLIDAEELDEICDDVGGLLGLDPEVIARKCTTDDRGRLLGALYECLIDWVISMANDAIRKEMADIATESRSDRSGIITPQTDDEGDVVSITVLEIPNQDLGRAVALRGVFDDSAGINAEMKDDGVPVEPAGSSVLKEMNNAVAQVSADLGIPGTAAMKDREHDLDRREAVLEKVGVEAEQGGFLKSIIYPVDGEAPNAGRHGRFDLSNLLGSSRVWYHLSIHPTDDLPAKLATLPSITSAWSAGSVSRQLRSWRLPEWANRRNRNLDYTADFDIEEFATRYQRLGCQEGRDGVESWCMERGWSNGEAVVGHERVWIRESAWWDVESMLDIKPEGEAPGFNAPGGGYAGSLHDPNASGFFPPPPMMGVDNEAYSSQDQLVQNRQASYADAPKSKGTRSIAPTMARTVNTMAGDYGLGAKGDDRRHYDEEFEGQLDAEYGEGRKIEQQEITRGRRLWVAFVWALTFWIPSPALRYIGRMKRPDVRMAWREKLVLIMLIFLLNAVIVFYIIWFGHLLCPNFDKAWNVREVATHQGEDDFYVAIHGKVYDITKFARTSHANIPGVTTDKNAMQPLAGMTMDDYFIPPLTLVCGDLVKDDQVLLEVPPTNVTFQNAVHTSGKLSPFHQGAIEKNNWYTQVFEPKIKGFYKGDLVWDPKNVSALGQWNPWVIINNKVYDMTDYFYTQKLRNPAGQLPHYSYFPSEVEDLLQSSGGEDITDNWKFDSDEYKKSLACMDAVFYRGVKDFRLTPRCQVNGVILLVFTCILCAVILVKFVSALQFGSKRRPAPQDKFVICQVPAYTEGEDQLRKGLDSLTALEYDNKRKLICVICDGMIVGGGNDRPTPKIVLDILGVDPKIDPPALPFKSVGTGSDQLNYGKVYSGLYEYEGNVVPYIVVVKVGKESEQTKSKPGNRGKRDSQILLMSFLNRVHHRAPMNPLELEMFHQINNIIGVDPELYEYLFMVDADTSVREDSLNRLVASCANDAKIAGICGETSLQNEERSWWTMIQVYEYYISHHLAKAFESLFGSVTCLPGCFCMYRLRTADKGRPLIINDKVIAEYSVGNVDTLHKKNLFSLGEDRYLTTLMTKHFPNMSYKFVPDAYAATAAPETWSVLLSQRRRWINSTIHNLAELMFLDNLCGFCCFSMRFVVFIDLFGTLILPATCAYLGYLIYRVATHSGQFPLISIVLIAAVYGLQALIFILKRQWQHVGWMIIYIIAYPIYSFVLPVYSFWKQDDFSWGNTRIVIGEKGSKAVVAVDPAADHFDPRSIPLQRWDDYAAQNSLPGRRGVTAGMEKPYYDAPGATQYSDNAYEMDDFRSTYSSQKAASTVLTGFPQNGAFMNPLSPPPAQSPYGQHHFRQSSTPSVAQQYRDAPQYAASQQRVNSMAGLSDHFNAAAGRPASREDLLDHQGTPPLRASRSPLGPGGSSRPPSQLDFRTLPSGPSEGEIADAVRMCLGEVDLDNVTKKQVRALVEQRLQTEIQGDKRAFLDKQIDTELANM